MTLDRFRQLYETARSAARVTGTDLIAVAFAERLYGEALDTIIEECDAHQAGMVDWAMDNGYPEFETVLRYGILKEP
jgi:hypothetical protein